MDNDYFKQCLDQFNDLPDEVRQIVGGFEAALAVKKMEDKYRTPLSFLTILLAIGELSFEEVPEYLFQKHQLDKERGKAIGDELIVQVFAPVIAMAQNTEEDVINDVLGEESPLEDPLATRSLSERRELTLDVFENRLVETLNADYAYLRELNIMIFKTFNDDPGLDDKVEALLYNNQEKISNRQISLDGRPSSPSAANWLKDFIKIYGSGLFSEVSLAEYLTKAPNIKFLGADEKELVRKLLKLYRNLSFFPESMDGILVENWEVFPVDQLKSDEMSMSPKPVSTPKPAPIIEPVPVSTPEPVPTSEPEPISSSTQFAEPATPEPATWPVDTAQEERRRMVLELQKSLTKYSPTSLEYKAIEQEINRLNREV